MTLTAGNFRFQTEWKGDILGPVDLSNYFIYTSVNNLFHKYEALGKEEMTINVLVSPSSEIFLNYKFLKMVR